MPEDQKPPEMQTFDTLIPAEFKDRQYLADLKALPVGPEGYTALFKKLDGAQTLIGKKTGIPEANAAPEEIEKFYNTLRPAKAEEYEIPVAEGKTLDAEVAKTFKGMFHEAGLSKAQAAKVAAGYEKFVQEKFGAQAAEAARLDAEFAEMTQKAFGADNAAVIARSKELLESLTPPALMPHMVKLSNEGLVLMAGVMENIRAKFMGEDKMGGGGNGGGAGADTATLREQARALQSSEAWTNFRHKDHATTIAKVNAIYAQLGKSGSK